MGMTKTASTPGHHHVVQLDRYDIERAIIEAISTRYPDCTGAFKSQVHWAMDSNAPKTVHHVTVELFVTDVAPSSGSAKDGRGG